MENFKQQAMKANAVINERKNDPRYNPSFACSSIISNGDYNFTKDDLSFSVVRNHNSISVLVTDTESRIFGKSFYCDLDSAESRESFSREYSHAIKDIKDSINATRDDNTYKQRIRNLLDRYTDEINDPNTSKDRRFYCHRAIGDLMDSTQITTEDIESPISKSIAEGSKYKQKLIGLRGMYQNLYNIEYKKSLKEPGNCTYTSKCVVYNGIIREINIILEED